MTYQPVSSELERVGCPVCAADEPALLYDVVAIPGCAVSLVRDVLPVAPSERVGDAAVLRRRRVLRERRRRLHELSPAGNVAAIFIPSIPPATAPAKACRRLALEVGCGYGFLLDEAKPYFDYRAGIDFSGAVKSASERADRVYQGDLDIIPDEERFDCIILVSVIEHVHKPVEDPCGDCVSACDQAASWSPPHLTSTVFFGSCLGAVRRPSGDP